MLALSILFKLISLTANAIAENDRDEIMSVLALSSDRHIPANQLLKPFFVEEDDTTLRGGMNIESSRFSGYVMVSNNTCSML